MTSQIDTFNKFVVGSTGKRIKILRQPWPPDGLSADDALLLAAYLVSMAESEASHTFAEVLEAVQNT